MQTTLIVLVVAIGLTTGSLAWRVASGPRVAPTTTMVDPAIGYAFYQALDDVLTTGDRSTLDRVVSSGYIDHSGDQKRTAEELVNRLASYRSFFPDLRIRVLEIRATGETLIASIAPAQSAGPVVEGLQLAPDPTAGGFEVLRIQHGKVSERWSSALPGIERASFADASFTFEPIASQSLKLEAIELPANSRFAWSSRGDRAVLVESGGIQLDISSTGSEGERLHASKTVATGQALSSPAGETAVVRTESGVSARVLVLTMQNYTPTNPSSIELGQGAKLTLLWSSYFPDKPTSAWHLSFGRVALAADSTGRFTGDAQSSVLLAGMSGTARLSVGSGQIAALSNAPRPESSESIALLDAGNAALVDRPAAMEIANTGGEPAVLWFIGVRIDAPSVTPAPSGGTPILAIHIGAGFKRG
jgi:hypothetical protein